MKYVVEIQSPGGDIGSVMRAVEIELRNYPNFLVTDIWQQGEREKSLSDETW